MFRVRAPLPHLAAVHHDLTIRILQDAALGIKKRHQVVAVIARGDGAGSGIRPLAGPLSFPLRDDAVEGVAAVFFPVAHPVDLGTSVFLV